MIPVGSKVLILEGQYKGFVGIIKSIKMDGGYFVDFKFRKGPTMVGYVQMEVLADGKTA